jgi:hypothetical protein
MKPKKTPVPAVMAEWADCPTPRKIRYNTRNAAKNAAGVRSRSTGFPLYVYRCRCGSWHMTRQRQEITDVPLVQVHGLGHILGMDDETFINTVICDITGDLDPSDGQFLRHPDVASRWKAGLTTVRQRVERQLASLNKLRSLSAEDDEWRMLLTETVDAITARQRECAGLLLPAVSVTPAVAATTAAVSKRLVRRSAGDRALELLVNRHLSEFTKLFHVEARRVGLPLDGPPKVDPFDQEELRRLRDLDVNGAYEATPRFPDAHLVLTGDESFDDVATLVIGVVYRYVRDSDDGPEAAARAVRDLTLLIERCPQHLVAELIHIASDWVTVHA